MDGRELGCGALQRRRAAADVVHQVFVLVGVFDASLLSGVDIDFPQNVTAETDQHEDHTFSGIMFDIKTNKLPLEYIEVSSVWVRGDLGRFCTVFECLHVLVVGGGFCHSHCPFTQARLRFGAQSSRTKESIRKKRCQECVVCVHARALSISQWAYVHMSAP